MPACGSWSLTCHMSQPNTAPLVGGSDCGWGVAGEPGWEVVEKANARALERGVVAVGVEGVAVHIARGGCPAE